MRKEVLSHIQYSGWKYFVVLLASILFWTTVFSALAHPKAHEKVSISCFVDELEIGLINERLNAEKESITAQKLKVISVENFPSGDPMLGVLLATRKITSDILIVSENVLALNPSGSAQVDPKTFIPFSREKLEELLEGKVENLDFYYVEGYAVGIYLNKEDGTSGRFGDFYKGNERCVAFLSNESVNLGSLYDIGDPSNRAALDVLVYLLTK